jgi:hypothetical protein
MYEGGGHGGEGGGRVIGPENAIGEWPRRQVSRGQASERAVCVYEAVSVEKGARRPPLPTAVVCPPGRRRRRRLAITAIRPDALVNAGVPSRVCVCLLLQDLVQRCLSLLRGKFLALQN